MPLRFSASDSFSCSLRSIATTNFLIPVSGVELMVTDSYNYPRRRQAEMLQMVTELTYTDRLGTGITLSVSDLKKEDWPRIYFRTQRAEDAKSVMKFWGGYQNVYELFTDWFLSLSHEQRNEFLSTISGLNKASSSRMLPKIPGMTTADKMNDRKAASTRSRPRGKSSTDDE